MPETIKRPLDYNELSKKRRAEQENDSADPKRIMISMLRFPDKSPETTFKATAHTKLVQQASGDFNRSLLYLSIQRGQTWK